MEKKPENLSLKVFKNQLTRLLFILKKWYSFYFVVTILGSPLCSPLLVNLCCLLY